MSTNLCEILGPILCPMMPYGTAVRGATASGDTTQMQIEAASARQWLDANPGHPAADDVRAALTELEAALARV